MPSTMQKSRKEEGLGIIFVALIRESKKFTTYFQWVHSVDLISRKGICFAEIYGGGNPAQGPKLIIPLEMQEPCFVRRRVLCTATEGARSRSNCASPLGGAHIYRHKSSSSTLLITMLIGSPVSSSQLSHSPTSTSLRCGDKWVYFSESNGTFTVSKPKKSENGICALKVYIEHMQHWGFDQSDVRGKRYQFPKRPKGRVRIGRIKSDAVPD